MNIMHVTKKYPGALGGDAVVVANLHKHQNEAGHTVSVLTSNCKAIKKDRRIYKFGLPDDPEALDRITIRRLTSLLMLCIKAFATLRKERPDIIHTHSIDMAFAVSFAARYYKVPLIHTFHILTFYDETQAWIRRKTELWLAKAARPVTITAPNKYDVYALIGAGFKQTVLLPNGVDLEFWRSQGPKLHIDPLPAHVFTFLSVGRIESQKGYEYLIRAVAQLRLNALKPFRVMIAGEGSQKLSLQQLALTLDVGSIVLFVGRKTPEEIRSMLGDSDVAVFCSLFETTPLTLLEAWAMGIPVITTRVGILRDIPFTTRRVYAVEPKDEYSLAAAMQVSMASAGSRAKVGAEGHKYALRCSWLSVAQTAEKLYGRMV